MAKASMMGAELNQDMSDLDIGYLTFIQCLREKPKELAVGIVEKEENNFVSKLEAQDAT